MKALFLLLVIVGQVNAQTILPSDLKPSFEYTITVMAPQTVAHVENVDEFPPFNVWNECVEDLKGDIGQAMAELKCTKILRGKNL
jgi:hypothetical protein